MWTTTAVALALAALAAGIAGPAAAAPITVVNGDRSITVDPATQDGLFNWNIGDVDQLRQQWFWFRAPGATAEASLDTLPLITAEAVGNQIHLVFNGEAFGVDVRYTLSGNRIDETVTITNNTAGVPLSLAWFEYTDLDVNGIADGDVASGDAAGITQGKDGRAVTVTPSPGADGFQIGPFADIRDLLNDGAVTNLDNTLSPFGPDDVTHAFQWNLTISDSLTLSKSKEFVVVPAPAALLLLVVGGGLVTLRSWRPRRARA